MQIGVDVSFPSAIGPMPGLPVEVEVGLLLPAAIGLHDPAGEFMLLVSAIIFFCFIRSVLQHSVNSINC